MREAMLKRENSVERNLLLVLPAIVLVIALIPLNTVILQHLFPIACHALGISEADCIGVKETGGKAPIGLSDGKFSFDTGPGRIDTKLKQQGAASLAAGDFYNAENYWQFAVLSDPSDAEAQIYLENQRVLDKHTGAYVTLVVGTILTGSLAPAGRDILQGAYLAQKAYNNAISNNPGHKAVRLLIANSGNDPADAGALAEQISRAAILDKSIIGIMGWSASGQSFNLASDLKPDHIPMVSPTSSSDTLTGISPYFFRIVPSDSQQAQWGADYAKNNLHAKNIILFEDAKDVYSQSLATAFQNSLGDSAVVNIGSYTRDRKNTITAGLQNMLKNDPQPDLIYFAGYSNDEKTLLSALTGLSGSQAKQLATLPVMGGDAAYELVRYYNSPRLIPHYEHLIFTAFASPDQWRSSCKPGQPQTCQRPGYFDTYASTFDPQHQTSDSYGRSLADADAILAYDATQVLLTASNSALRKYPGQDITPEELTQALKQISGRRAFQGISGPISFSNGDPLNKPVVVLTITPEGKISIVMPGS